jgi:serine/threonine-protein kinase
VLTAVRRLGFLGLIVALMGSVSHVVERLLQPERVHGLFPPLAAGVFLVVGLTIFILSRSRKVRPETVLDLGLVSEVVIALAISLTEFATPFKPYEIVRGLSWNCLWIAMYVVAIPGTYGKMVLAAMTAACMGPIGMLVTTVATGAPPPTLRQAVLLLVPPFAAALWAIPVARHYYRLGAQVTKAQAMGSYELLELIGRGGMGEVWRARHRMLARVSAIKLIRPQALSVHGGESAGVMLRRFEREAKAMAALRSPHTVEIYDYGVSEDGRFYYVMELLDGLDLETLVERFGQLPAGRVAWILRQAAKSLSDAHACGLVHRDVKPRNLFACRMGSDYDFVKVLDFGLVKLSTAGSSQTRLTMEGVTAGTPAYMAPEIAMGSQDVDARSDLYSLGCVGYWLLTGQLVFQAENPMAMVMAHLQQTPVPPSERSELPIPASLEHVILRCLEKEPDKRPANARELAGLLAHCEGLEPWSAEQAERWWSVNMPRAHA